MDKNIEIPSENKYNIKDKTAQAIPVLKGRFVPDGKRTTKITDNRRRKELNPLWRNISNLLVLQKTAFQVALAKESTIQPKDRRLSSSRTYNSHNFCNNRRHKPFEQDKDFTREWFFPENNWAQRISICKQSQEIPKKNRPPNYLCYKQDSQLSQAKDVLFAATSNKYFIGLRFNSYNCLWQTNRRCQSWLQSRQERETVIPSACMFRILHQGLLARNITARGCIHFSWCCSVSQRMSEESSALYLSYSDASRFRFFRSQIHRTFRRKRYWLCGSSQIDQNHKRETFRATLSQVPEGLVSCRIPIYTDELERTASLYSSSQKTSRQTDGTTNTFHSGTLLLPSICNKSSRESSQCLVFLQKTSRYRNSYQRSKTRLLFNKNTYEQFPCESNVFHSTSFRIQYCQLVQTTLSAKTIAECNFTNNTHRYSCTTGKVDKIRKQKFAQITGRIYFKTNAELHNEEN